MPLSQKGNDGPPRRELVRPYRPGLRLGELAHLQIGDVELPGRISREADTLGRLHILAKGRKERYIPLNYKACRALRSWLDVRPDAPTEALFVSKFGRGWGRAPSRRWCAST